MDWKTVIGNDLDQASHWLRKGELVAIPTETVYGLAGNALDEKAVVKIFETKQRPLYNPLIIHVADAAQARSLVLDWDAQVQALMDTFWPGPLTLLLDRSPAVPDLVCAGLSRVALRMPDHPLTLDLIKACDFPLAAPSANLFGRISPTTADHVRSQLDQRIPYILDGGPCRVGVESTIIGREQDEWKVYRIGGITLADLRPILGSIGIVAPSNRPDAPGMLPWHYAPRTTLTIGEPLDSQGDRIGWLRFSSLGPGVPGERQFVLAPDGDLYTAARRLYAGLHELDALGLDHLIAEPVPDQGIGRAINDRLRRAAAPRILKE
ncbi:MAG: threonylcarbamoyl-AMP synthase [Saprospiraceae bacterium]|nr:threonylcarbamoyl-AMP synthase [Saprospiraceae bacterium]